jgi:hypothetical protein
VKSDRIIFFAFAALLLVSLQQSYSQGKPDFASSLMVGNESAITELIKGNTLARRL